MPPRKKKRRSSRRKKTWLSSRLPIVFLLTAAGLITTVFLLGRQQPPLIPATSKQPPALLKKIEPVAATAPTPESPLSEPMPARFALVIDDMGYHQKVGDALLELPLPLSFAFLPFAPHTDSQLAHARQQGRDILLHLPMEPTDSKWNPGPGALYTNMDQAAMRRTLLQNLTAIPDAIGINNHMGSLFTASEPAMRDLLGLLKQLDLFFLDSLTTPKSVGVRVARELGVLTMRRHVFLDNQQDKDKITKQLEVLTFLARKQGIAIGIAHPHQATLDALRDFLRHQDPTVEMVSIRTLMQEQ